MYEVQTRQKSFCHFFFLRESDEQTTWPDLPFETTTSFFFQFQVLAADHNLRTSCSTVLVQSKNPKPKKDSNPWVFEEARYTRLLAHFSFYTIRITTNTCSLVVIKKILKLFFFVGQQKRTCLIPAVLSSLKPWLKPFLVVDSFSFASSVSASY